MTLSELLERVKAASIIHTAEIERDAADHRAEKAEAALSEARADKDRMDWLEQHEVEVRLGLPHGSRHLFYATPDDSYEGEIGPSNIRALIDRALAEKDRILRMRQSRSPQSRRGPRP
jgi:hypothetical protein